MPMTPAERAARVAQIQTHLRNKPTMNLEFLAGLSRLFREHGVSVEPEVLANLTLASHGTTSVSPPPAPPQNPPSGFPPPPAPPQPPPPGFSPPPAPPRNPPGGFSPPPAPPSNPPGGFSPPPAPPHNTGS